MFLLDTNVISELRKTGTSKANADVVAWASTVPVADLYLCAITVLELELGILQLERKDPSQAQPLRKWLEEQVLPSFRGRILPVDTAVAVRCAALHVPNRRSERDALIAATALAHGMTVVTRNISDFSGTGVPLIDPWVGATS